MIWGTRSPPPKSTKKFSHESHEFTRIIRRCFHSWGFVNFVADIEFNEYQADRSRSCATYMCESFITAVTGWKMQSLEKSNICTRLKTFDSWVARSKNTFLLVVARRDFRVFRLFRGSLNLRTKFLRATHRVWTWCRTKNSQANHFGWDYQGGLM